MKMGKEIVLIAVFLIGGIALVGLCLFGDQSGSLSKWYVPGALACFCEAGFLIYLRHEKKGKDL